MPPVIPNPAAIIEFKSQAAFEKWLAKNHASATEVWIKVHKKASGLESITCPEALDVALCYGWIDAIRKSLDDTSFLQRYTPRTKKSIWSLINTEHVTRLINEQRMQAAGHAQIEAAKADGRWEKAYGGAKKMTAPDDLMAAISASKKARAMYETLTSQNRYALSFRIQNLKTDAARARNIEAFVKMLERGETFYPNGKAVPAKVKVATAKTVSPKLSAKKSTTMKQPAKKIAARKTARKKS